MRDRAPAPKSDAPKRPAAPDRSAAPARGGAGPDLGGELLARTSQPPRQQPPVPVRDEASLFAAAELAWGPGVSQARIHRDPAAGALAELLGASAVTRGIDVFFAPGAYAPQTPEGRQLIAHELAHVAQNAQHSPAAGVTRPNEPAEREASLLGSQLLSGAAAAPAERPSAAAQRQESHAPTVGPVEHAVAAGGVVAAGEILGLMDGTITAIEAVPEWMRPASADTLRQGLVEHRPFLVAIQDGFRNPGAYVAAAKTFLLDKAKQVPPYAEGVVAELSKQLDPENAEPVLFYLRQYGSEFLSGAWSLIAGVLWEQLFPWQGMLTDLGSVVTHLGNAWDAIKVLDTSTAIDETLAAEQLLEGIVGRWSLYFFLAMVALGAAGGALPSSFIGTLAGAILGVGVGAPAGTATGGLAGALAGATAGAAFAESVGIALLVEASVAQVAIVTKAILDLTRGAQTDEEKQKDWASIGGAAMSLAIFAVMFLIGAGAQRVAAALVKRVGPKLQRWVAKASRETAETAPAAKPATGGASSANGRVELPRATPESPPDVVDGEVPPTAARATSEGDADHLKVATEPAPETPGRAAKDKTNETEAQAVLAGKAIVAEADATDLAISELTVRLYAIKLIYPFIRRFELDKVAATSWSVTMIASEYLLGTIHEGKEDLGVPGVKGGRFQRWFDELSPDELDELWKNPKIRDDIEDRLRQPGGLHEWLMVSRAPVFKRWGMSADDIQALRTPIEGLGGVNPPWRHGKKGSSVAHNEILQIIDSSLDYETFVRRLQTWADYRLTGGAAALPEGLRR